jgi:hypothetical protein
MAASPGLGQLDLFDGAPVAKHKPRKKRGRRPSIQKAFLLFHRVHPEVMDRLVLLTRSWIEDEGFHHGGISLLWERLRHYWRELQTDEDSEYKLNNNFRSRYVRLMIQEHPEFAEFFEIRELRSA